MSSGVDTDDGTDTYDTQATGMEMTIQILRTHADIQSEPHFTALALGLSNLEGDSRFKCFDDFEAVKSFLKPGSWRPSVLPQLTTRWCTETKSILHFFICDNQNRKLFWHLEARGSKQTVLSGKDVRWGVPQVEVTCRVNPSHSRLTMGEVAQTKWRPANPEEYPFNLPAALLSVIEHCEQSNCKPIEAKRRLCLHEISDVSTHNLLPKAASFRVHQSNGMLCDRECMDSLLQLKERLKVQTEGAVSSRGGRGTKFQDGLMGKEVYIDDPVANGEISNSWEASLSQYDDPALSVWESEWLADMNTLPTEEARYEEEELFEDF